MMREEERRSWLMNGAGVGLQKATKIGGSMPYMPIAVVISSFVFLLIREWESVTVPHAFTSSPDV